jgi:hypothetical protein
VHISVASRGLDLPPILTQNVNGARITADLLLRTAANGHKKANKGKAKKGIEEEEIKGIKRKKEK